MAPGYRYVIHAKTPPNTYNLPQWCKIEHILCKAIHEYEFCILVDISAIIVCKEIAIWISVVILQLHAKSFLLMGKIICHWCEMASSKSE